jgi:hypothetical protein
VSTSTKCVVGYDHAYKPYGETQVLVCRVQQILAEYENHLPLTVRQIYYRLIASPVFGYEKGKKFQKKLYDALQGARRAKVIPFESIRDDGIVGGGYWTPDLATHLSKSDRKFTEYDLDRQSGQLVKHEIWCEAAGMRGQLAKVAAPYSIPVYSCGGFNSVTAVHQISQRVREDTTVLHLGDYDPSGECIFESVRQDVIGFLEDDAPAVVFDAVRVALTPEQIAEHSLPMGGQPDPKDPRTKAWRAAGKGEICQLEALPPDVIGNILREAIEDHIDLDVRADALDRERLERAALKSEPSRISSLWRLEQRIEDRPLELLYPSPRRAAVSA